VIPAQGPGAALRCGPGQGSQDDPCGAGLAQAYEQLRVAALQTRGAAFAHGLAVMTAKGVAGWMRAVTEHAVTPPTAAVGPRPSVVGTPATAGSAAVSTLPAAVTRELISVLAAMTLTST
jgi:hypothetical protein